MSNQNPIEFFTIYAEPSDSHHVAHIVGGRFNTFEVAKAKIPSGGYSDDVVRWYYKVISIKKGDKKFDRVSANLPLQFPYS